jgi:hypothetical protein
MDPEFDIHGKYAAEPVASSNGRSLDRGLSEKLDVPSVDEISTVASWLREDEGLDGESMYTRSASAGDRKTLVGLYGSNCPIATVNKGAEAHNSAVERISTVLPCSDC